MSPETCRVKHLRRINRNCCISLGLFSLHHAIQLIHNILAFYKTPHLTKRTKISFSTTPYPDAFHLINYRLQKLFSFVLAMDVGCFACSVRENFIPDQPFVHGQLQYLLKGFQVVSFGSFSSMTSYQIASLLKQIRPVSAEL